MSKGVIGQQLGNLNGNKGVSRRNFLKLAPIAALGVGLGVTVFNSQNVSNEETLNLAESSKKQRKEENRIHSKKSLSNADNLDLIQGEIPKGGNFNTSYRKCFDGFAIDRLDLEREVEIMDNLIRSKLGVNFRYQPNDQFEVVRNSEEGHLHNIVQFNFKRNNNKPISAVNLEGIFYNLDGTPFIDKFLPIPGPHYISCLFNETRRRRIPHRGVDLIGVERGAAFGRESWMKSEGKRKEFANVIGSEIIFPHKRAKVHRVNSNFNSRPKFGNYLILENENKINGKRHYSLAYHLSPFHLNNEGNFEFGSMVKEGDIVEQGDIIGYYGRTGFNQGPHLHWQECLTDEKKLYPKKLMPAYCNNNRNSKIPCFNPLDILPKVSELDKNIYSRFYDTSNKVVEYVAGIKEVKNLNLA